MDGSPFRYIRWSAGTFTKDFFEGLKDFRGSFENQAAFAPSRKTKTKNKHKSRHFLRGYRINVEKLSLVSLQVAQMIITVKTACLYMLTMATGMTTTASTKEATSAKKEVRQAVLFDSVCTRW